MRLRLVTIAWRHTGAEPFAMIVTEDQNKAQQLFDALTAADTQDHFLIEIIEPDMFDTVIAMVRSVQTEGRN